MIQPKAHVIKPGSSMETVYHCLIDSRRNGATSFEIANETGLSRRTVSNQIDLLKCTGKIVDSGYERDSKDTKRKATVWVDRRFA